MKFLLGTTTRSLCFYYTSHKKPTFKKLTKVMDSLCHTPITQRQNWKILDSWVTLMCRNNNPSFDSHFQSQNFASSGGRGMRWRELGWCRCCCCSSSRAAGTGRRTAPSPPRTAAPETARQGQTHRVTHSKWRTEEEQTAGETRQLQTFDTSALCVAKQCCR